MKKTRFAGNGLSRTAMLFKIATIAGHKLTIPETKQVQGRESTQSGASV